MKIFDCDRKLGIMINGTRYDSIEVDELTSKKLKLYIDEHGVDYNIR